MRVRRVAGPPKPPMPLVNRPSTGLLTAVNRLLTRSGNLPPVTRLTQSPVKREVWRVCDPPRIAFSRDPPERAISEEASPPPPPTQSTVKLENICRTAKEEDCESQALPRDRRRRHRQQPDSRGHGARRLDSAGREKHHARRWAVEPQQCPHVLSRHRSRVPPWQAFAWPGRCARKLFEKWGCGGR